jgi:hypothetical protein
MTISNQAVLPAYVRWHESPSGDIYYRIEVSTRMRNAGFPIPYFSLGTRYDEAMETYDREFRPVLKAWKESKSSITVEAGPVYGSLRWALTIWKSRRRWRALSKRSQGTYEDAILRLSDHTVRGGRFAGTAFGDLPLKAISEGFADDVYEEYVYVVDKDGNVTDVERPGMARQDFQTARTMINVIKRKYKHLLFEGGNVFEGMDMPHRKVGRAPVTDPQLARFLRGADRKNLGSVAAIALYGYEMFGRAESFPFKATVDYFRSPGHEHEIFVSQQKVGKTSWFDLFNDEGEPLYPELIKRLTKLKGRRKEGALFPCERAATGQIRPWRKAELSEAIKEICEAEGLPPLVLSQFRKGGLTESGEAGLTTSQIMAASMHTVEDTVHIYIEKNKEVAAGGQQKRLAYRERKARRKAPKA